MGKQHNTPIFIMSFNRPEYLRRVLESLRTQVDCDLDRRRLVLWQDGALSRFTGRERARIADIESCKAAFKEIFPEGTVMNSEVNLGVALNFDRAECFAFEELQTDAAIFLEDDLVLSPHYIATLDQLIATFAEDSRVGYVAAYGDHRNSLSDQQINQHKLVLLYHNWGFALYRRQWLRMRERVLRYLSLLKDREYTERDHAAIFELFASWGFAPPASSQDAAKTVICCMDDVIKLNTYVCNAAYIGERGIHMNPEAFARDGYGNTVIHPNRVTQFEHLGESLYKALLTQQVYWARRLREPITTAASPTLRSAFMFPKILGNFQFYPEQFNAVMKQTGAPFRFFPHAIINLDDSGQPVAQDIDPLPSFAALEPLTLVIRDKIFNHYFHCLETLIAVFTTMKLWFKNADVQYIHFGGQSWANPRQKDVQAELIKIMFPRARVFGAIEEMQASAVLLYDRRLCRTKYNKLLEPLLLPATNVGEDFKSLILDALNVRGDPKAVVPKPRVLYVTRPEPRCLDASDEEFVLSELRASFTVESVDFAKFAWADQVRTASESGALVGVHGNGLSNLCWLPKGSLVLEFFPVKTHHYDYQFLCEIFGIDYWGIEGENVFRTFSRIGPPYGHDAAVSRGAVSLHRATVEGALAQIFHQRA